MKNPEMNKKPHYLIALLPVLLLITLLVCNVFLYAENSLGGANQLALLLAGSLASLIGSYYGVKWKKIINTITKSVSSTTSAIIILLLIGSLSGTWLLSGIVPAMIYYGLQILNPKIFLLATCVICAIVSLATGSSWSTIATIGIALVGIGQALGFSIGVTAGAIISGSYFGDKMSPLSDTTNLAPAISGTDLFTHIRYMMYTTIPSFVISLIIFLIIGINYKAGNTDNINELLYTIENTFTINIYLFLIPIIVILLIIKKTPPIPTLLAGSLLGGLFAIIFQPDIILSVSKENSFSLKASYMAIINAMGNKITISTENQMIDDLLSTGGMYGMLNTIWLIMCAMIFGGAMEASKLLTRISEPIIRLAKNTGSLVATTAGTCIFFNITVSDQYLSIIVPGKMFSKTYTKKGLSAENLSRTLEDAGTVTSVLIPWNTCGATQSAVLGVATFTYLPYCFFNIISPFMTILYAYLGIKIKKIQK